MKTKKLPYYLFLAALTGGASLTLGFLSFTGAMALWPALGFGISFFVLSVAYEGEIYLQNIKGALNKLFQSSYTRRRLANEFLLEHLPDALDEKTPAFIHDYHELLRIEQQYQHAAITNTNQQKLKRIKKSIKQADKVFTELLFTTEPLSPEENAHYLITLQTWIHSRGTHDLHQTLQSRKRWYQGTLAFSAVCAVLMGLGTVYLLTGPLLSIPFFAALPLPILGAGIAIGALFSGLAYGLLTYNSIVDMINNDTLSKWYQKVKNDLRDDFGPRSFIMASAALALAVLSLVMTVCTAGTWWTIVKETPKVFTWMKYVPSAISTACMPFFLGISSLIFNVENTAETLENVDEIIKQSGTGSASFFKGFTSSIEEAWNRESPLQRLNPFRILLKLTYMPLKVVLFVGHLLSIAVTSDRVPGMSETLSALLGFLQEGFTDVNYFFNTKEPSPPKTARERLEHRSKGGGEHDHNSDIPSVLLKWAFSPIFAAASLWHFLCANQPYSQENLFKSWELHFAPHASHRHRTSQPMADTANSISPEFKVHMALSRLKQWRKAEGVDRQHPNHRCLTALEQELRCSNRSISEVGSHHTGKQGVGPKLFSKLQAFEMKEEPQPFPKTAYPT